ncbi:unnamed protein product [Rhizoctonia solani]|uniref:Uncharacterized protein n=1 Tax=Rhizoctonia solani TaxID=456999 RepID=A0A8H3C5C9_9AGAM|nr:unnamed protein product [Rhizoctonia solani]CAE6495461.1 unnamed protein product [Rhizoctonia solani]
MTVAMMGRPSLDNGSPSNDFLRMMKDPALVAKDLTRLAEMLAEQGKLEEALDASQAATTMYQHSLGLPVVESCDQVSQCKCDIPNTDHDELLLCYHQAGVRTSLR